MKNIGKIYIVLLSLVALFVSCSNEESLDGNSTMTISGVIESGTKTVLNSDYTVFWTQGDAISLFDDAATVEYNSSIGNTAVASAQFTGNALSRTEEIYALYPHSPSASADYAAKNITFNLPAVQQYDASGSFASGVNPTAAVSAQGGLFNFKNLCGALRFSLIGNKSVHKIVVYTSDKSVALCGDATVDMNAGVALQMGGVTTENSSVTLDCGDGVMLSESATEFIVVLPPVSNSLCVDVYFDSEGSDIWSEMWIDGSVASNNIVAGRIVEIDGVIDTPRAGTTTPTNLLLNDGFEEGTNAIANNWSGSNSDRIAATAQASYEGGYSGRIKPQTGTLNQTITVEPGKTYSVSAFVRWVAPTATQGIADDAKMTIHNGGATDPTIASVDVGVATTWTSISGEVTIPAGVTQVTLSFKKAKLGSNSMNTPALLIDNCVFIEK